MVHSGKSARRFKHTVQFLSVCPNPTQACLLYYTTYREKMRKLIGSFGVFIKVHSGKSVHNSDMRGELQPSSQASAPLGDEEENCTHFTYCCGKFWWTSFSLNSLYTWDLRWKFYTRYDEVKIGFKKAIFFLQICANNKNKTAKKHL